MSGWDSVSIQKGHFPGETGSSIAPPAQEVWGVAEKIKALQELRVSAKDLAAIEKQKVPQDLIKDKVRAMDDGRMEIAIEELRQRKGRSQTTKTAKETIPSLHLSAQREDANFVKIITAQRTEINQRDSFGKTPIFYALINKNWKFAYEMWLQDAELDAELLPEEEMVLFYDYAVKRCESEIDAVIARGEQQEVLEIRAASLRQGAMRFRRLPPSSPCTLL